MTDAQESALQDIRRIALANFGSFVMAGRITAEDSDNSSDYLWISTGPYSDCMGLCWILRYRLEEAYLRRHAEGGTSP